MPLYTEAQRISHFHQHPDELLTLPDNEFIATCALRTSDGINILHKIFAKNNPGINIKLLHRFFEKNIAIEMLEKPCGQGRIVLHHIAENLALLTELNNLLEHHAELLPNLLRLWEIYDAWGKSPIGMLSDKKNFREIKRKIVERFIPSILQNFLSDDAPDPKEVTGVTFFVSQIYHEEDLALRIIFDPAVSDPKRMIKILGYLRKLPSYDGGYEYGSIFAWLTKGKLDFLLKILDVLNSLDPNNDCSDLLYIPVYDNSSNRFIFSITALENVFRLLSKFSASTRENLLARKSNGTHNKYNAPGQGNSITFNSFSLESYLSGLLKEDRGENDKPRLYNLGFLQALSLERNNAFVTDVVKFILDLCSQYSNKPENSTRFFEDFNGLFEFLKNVLSKEQTEQPAWLLENINKNKAGFSAKFFEKLCLVIKRHISQSESPVPLQRALQPVTSASAKNNNPSNIVDLLKSTDHYPLYEFLRTRQEIDLSRELLVTDSKGNITLELIKEPGMLLSVLKLLGSKTRGELLRRILNRELVFNTSTLNLRFNAGVALNQYFAGMQDAGKLKPNIDFKNSFYFTGFFQECLAKEHLPDSLKRAGDFVLNRFNSENQPLEMVLQSFAHVFIEVSQKKISVEDANTRCAQLIIANERNPEYTVTSFVAGISAEFIAELIVQRPRPSAPVGLSQSQQYSFG
jgi:hypothetical protein